MNPQENKRNILWNNTYNKVYEYVLNNNYTYPSYTKDYKLNRWVSTQKYKYSIGKVPQERIQLLEKIPDWKWNEKQLSNSVVNSWLNIYNRFAEFVDKMGTLPTSLPDFLEDKNASQVCSVEEFKTLRTWMYHTQMNYYNKKLSKMQIDLLEKIPYWEWSYQKSPSRPKTWIKKYVNLLEFTNKNNRSPKVKEKMYYNWVRKQKDNFDKLSQTRKTLLSRISYVDWNKKMILWEDGYNELMKFINMENRLPTMHDSKRLAYWVYRQRQYYKTHKLSSHQIELLESNDKWWW